MMASALLELAHAAMITGHYSSITVKRSLRYLSSVILHMFGFSTRQRISLTLKDELSAGNSPSVWLQLRASLDLRCLS
ncbi:uncharacterized [Tachysurus ichikawai]